MRTVKEGKTRYRETLREFVECLGKRIETAELLCEQEKAASEKAETEQRATSTLCALSLGKTLKLQEAVAATGKGNRRIGDLRVVREELKRKLEESRAISSELSIHLRSPRCRLCPN